MKKLIVSIIFAMISCSSFATTTITCPKPSEIIGTAACDSGNNAGQSGYYSTIAMPGGWADPIPYPLPTGTCFHLTSSNIRYQLVIGFTYYTTTSDNTVVCGGLPSGYNAGLTYSCIYTDDNNVSQQFLSKNAISNASGCTPCDSSNYLTMQYDCNSGCTVTCTSP